MQPNLHEQSISFIDTQITVPAPDAPPPLSPEVLFETPETRVSIAINLLERIARPECPTDFKEMLGAFYNHVCKESEERRIYRANTGTNNLPASYWDDRSKAGEWNCYIDKANDYLGSPEKFGLPDDIAFTPRDFVFHNERYEDLTLEGLAHHRPADSKEIDAYLADGQRGLADLFAAKVAGSSRVKGDKPLDAIVYVTEAKEWRRYEDGVFLKVDDNSVTRLVGDTLSPILQAREKKLADTVKQMSENKSIPESWKALLKENQDRLKSIRSIRSNVNSAKYARDVAALASPLLKRSAADFDTKGHLLVVGNGTLNLKTGELHPWSMDDLSTVKIKTKYNTEAKCPRWEAFVKTIMCGKEDLAAYLQRVTGFMLSGEVSEEAFFVFWGVGGNGKGAYTNALKSILGKYATTMESEVITGKQDGEAKVRAMGGLVGKRAAFVNELKKGAELNEEAVKNMSGKGSTMARRLYCDAYEMEITHKIFICTNDVPTINGTDKGIWRRMQLVPFKHEFSGAEKRPSNIVHAEFMEEAEGILTWLVNGYFEFVKVGLNPPAEVTAAIGELRGESDSFGAFMTERLDANPQALVTTGELFTAYEVWCDKSGDKLAVSSNRKMRSFLKARGLTVEEVPGARVNRSSPTNCLFGFRLRPASSRKTEPPGGRF